MDEDIVHAGLAQARDLHVELGIDRLPHRHPALSDLPHLLPADGRDPARAASTTAKTLPTPTEMSTATSPIPSTSIR